MSTLPTSSRWKDQEPKHFSIPLPEDSDDYFISMERLQCTRDYCAVAVDDTVYVYSLPDFSLKYSLQHRDWISAFHIERNALVALLYNNTIQVTNLLTGFLDAYLDVSNLWTPETRICCTSDNPDKKGIPRRHLIILWQPASIVDLGFYVWKLPYLGDQIPTSVQDDGSNDLQHISPPLVGSWSQVFCLDALGATAVTGSTACTVHVWDLDSGECIWTLVGHSQGVKQVSLDESKVYSVSLDRTARIWDRLTGDCLHVLRSPEGVNWLTVLGPTYMVSFSYGYRISVWSYASGELLYEMPVTNGSNIAGHHDDRKMVVLYNYLENQEATETFKVLKVFDTQTGQLLKHVNVGDLAISYCRMVGRFWIALARLQRRWSLQVWDFNVDDDDDPVIEGQGGSPESCKPPNQAELPLTANDSEVLGSNPRATPSGYGEEWIRKREKHEKRKWKWTGPRFSLSGWKILRKTEKSP